MPWNQYSNFIHNISINELAYGYPYDDQGNYSSNNQLKSDPGIATVNLYPLAAGGATPVFATTSLPAGSVAPAPFNQYANMIEVTGGTGPYFFSILAGGTTASVCTWRICSTPRSKAGRSASPAIATAAPPARDQAAAAH